MQDQEWMRARLLTTVRGLLLIGVCLVYANSMNNGFHFDDFHTVVDNPAIRSLRHVPTFFTDASTFSVLPANRTYRPVVSTMLALDYALGRGYGPFWFHLSTILLFLLLLFLITRISEVLFEQTRPSTANAWLGLLVAAWFGLHPAMAETVNYVIQRGDIYCTLGCVAALYLFVNRPHQRARGVYLLPLVAALLSKPPAAAFPLLLFSYLLLFETADRMPLQRLRRALIAATPSIVVTGLLLWLQFKMTPLTFLPSILSPAEYRWTQPYVWLRYFGALWLPLHLSVDSDLRPVAPWGMTEIAGISFVVALVLAIWSCRRGKLRPVAFGLLWFVLTQLPTSLYPLSELENDHRMFFSFVGLMLAAVWGGWFVYLRLVERSSSVWAVCPKTVVHASTVCIVLFALTSYAWGTHVRNQVWFSEETLWQDDVIKSPNNGRGLMIYGLTQMNKGNYAKALALFESALVYTPNYPTLEINLGVLHGAIADQHNPDPAQSAEAERHFLRAIKLAPEDDLTHAYYGRWLSAHGRMPEAISQLQTAVRLNPQRLIGHQELMLAYRRSGDSKGAKTAADATLAMVPNDALAQQIRSSQPSEAASFWINASLAQYEQGHFVTCIEMATRALQIDSESSLAYNNIGAAYAGLQQWDDAIFNENKALQLNPSLQIATNNLKRYQQLKAEKVTSAATPTRESASDLLNDSLRLNQAGDYKGSLIAARAALRLDPHFAEAWNNIAADYEAMHRWNEAITAAQRAIVLKPNFALARNNLAWSLSQRELHRGR